MNCLPEGLPRRAVLKISLVISGLLAMGGLARFLSYREPPAASRRVPLGPPGVYPIGSVTPVLQAQAWLIRDELGLYAVSARCTHLGCTVADNSTGFSCPCHGSGFRYDGLVVRGPALQPLAHLELSLTDDQQLILDGEATVPASQRLSASG